jgi:glycosyltransferase involved in cell wall biosynthesis
MKIVYICQAVDRSDPINASNVRWIEVFARKPSVEEMTVLALRVGAHNLPDNVTVRRFGTGRKSSTLLKFYGEVARSLAVRPDCFFIHQGGPYPALLFPFRLMGKPIYQWKAHPRVGLTMAWYARFCDTKIFTSARAAFPLALRKVKVVGQGVDTDVFRDRETGKSEDLLAVGRVTPIKGIDQMILAVEEANRRFGTSYRLNVYGPTLQSDEGYARHLQSMLARLKADAFVSFHGPVTQDELPEILSRHRVCLSFSQTAVDRSAVEAMACAVPVISTNACIGEIMPPEFCSLLLATKNNTARQAELIHNLLQMPSNDLAGLGLALRQLVLREHSVERLFDKILEEMHRP